MDMLADLLANGKTSRLYQALVYDRRLAVDVSAFQGSRELGSFFMLVATGTPGRPLPELAAPTTSCGATRPFLHRTSSGIALPRRSRSELPPNDISCSTAAWR
jgi:hypothetical protein